jgi:hypothetical protein
MPSRSSVRARLVWPERSRPRVEGGEQARPATMPDRCLGELPGGRLTCGSRQDRAIELGARLPLLPLAARALLIVCGPTGGPLPGCARPAPSRHGAQGRWCQRASPPSPAEWLPLRQPRQAGATGQPTRHQGMTGGIFTVHHRFLLGQRHCRSVPATSLEGPGRGRSPGAARTPNREVRGQPLHDGVPAGVARCHGACAWRGRCPR